jgi:hypothetical protein
VSRYAWRNDLCLLGVIFGNADLLCDLLVDSSSMGGGGYDTLADDVADGAQSPLTGRH